MSSIKPTSPIFRSTPAQQYESHRAIMRRGFKREQALKLAKTLNHQKSLTLREMADIEANAVKDGLDPRVAIKAAIDAANNSNPQTQMASNYFQTRTEPETFIKATRNKEIDLELEHLKNTENMLQVISADIFLEIMDRNNDIRKDENGKLVQDPVTKTCDALLQSTEAIFRCKFDNINKKINELVKERYTKELNK
jgi:hypothetical protein